MSKSESEAMLIWDVAEAMNEAEEAGVSPERAKKIVFGYAKGRQVERDDEEDESRTATAPSG